MQNLNAEIISIGTEILLGEITDTNSVHIARALRDLGINLYFMTSVGDNEGRIADSIRIAMSRAQIVITTGGLGPTVDDMTRQAVAIATDRSLTFHQHLLDMIAERFANFRAQMTENNKRQAYLPDDSIIIENPVGTAPSFIVEYKDSVVISLPGVPREMKYLFAERVIPYLREKYQLGDGIIKARVLRTAGIGESMLDDQIGQELLNAANPSIGLAAHSGQVDVRITAKAESEAEADAMIARMESQVRERIGDYIFGVDKETIEGALAALLLERGAKVAITEVATGGVVETRLRTLPEAEQIIAESVLFDDIPSMVTVLRLENAPVRELALRAAEAMYKRHQASIGIAVVSRPDMDEHHADSDEGTAIAVYLPEKSRSRVYGFGGQSEVARAWAGTWSMSMAWNMLKETSHAT